MQPSSEKRKPLATISAGSAQSTAATSASQSAHPSKQQHVASSSASFHDATASDAPGPRNLSVHAVVRGAKTVLSGEKDKASSKQAVHAVVTVAPSQSPSVQASERSPAPATSSSSASFPPSSHSSSSLSVVPSSSSSSAPSSRRFLSLQGGALSLSLPQDYPSSSLGRSVDDADNLTPSKRPRSSPIQSCSSGSVDKPVSPTEVASAFTESLQQLAEDVVASLAMPAARRISAHLHHAQADLAHAAQVHCLGSASTAPSEGDCSSEQKSDSSSSQAADGFMDDKSADPLFCTEKMPGLSMSASSLSSSSSLSASPSSLPAPASSAAQQQEQQHRHQQSEELARLRASHAALTSRTWALLGAHADASNTSHVLRSQVQQAAAIIDQLVPIAKEKEGVDHANRRLASDLKYAAIVNRILTLNEETSVTVPTSTRVPLHRALSSASTSSNIVLDTRSGSSASASSLVIPSSPAVSPSPSVQTSPSATVFSSSSSSSSSMSSASCSLSSSSSSSSSSPSSSSLSSPPLCTPSPSPMLVPHTPAASPIGPIKESRSTAHTTTPTATTTTSAITSLPSSVSMRVGPSWSIASTATSLRPLASTLSHIEKEEGEEAPSATSTAAAAAEGEEEGEANAEDGEGPVEVVIDHTAPASSADNTIPPRNVASLPRRAATFHSLPSAAAVPLFKISTPHFLTAAEVVELALLGATPDPEAARSRRELQLSYALCQLKEARGVIVSLAKENDSLKDKVCSECVILNV